VIRSIKQGPEIIKKKKKSLLKTDHFPQSWRKAAVGCWALKALSDPGTKLNDLLIPSEAA
jgi:hypothetical protein